MLTHWLAESLLYATSLMPVAFFFARGCCCGCSICSDNFGRSDGTDITTGSACGWTEVSGSWSIASGELTNSDVGLVICNTNHPDSNITAIVEVDFKNDTAGGKTVDVVVGYVDANNYYMARYTINGASSKVEIIKRTGGADGAAIATSSAFTMNANTWYTAKVCVTSDGQIAARVDNITRVATITAQTITGTQVGMNIKFGSSVTTFDNFVFSKSYNTDGATTCDGCEPLCARCTAGTVPLLVQLDLAGVAAGTSCTLAQCDAVATGTFILAYGNPPVSDAAAAACSWWYDIDPNSCGIFWWRVYIQPGSPDTIQAYAPNVPLGSFGPGWSYTATSPHDCEWIAFDSWTSFGATGGPCNQNSMTAQITAIY